MGFHPARFQLLPQGSKARPAKISRVIALQLK
jgi:hypothetical protein